MNVIDKLNMNLDGLYANGPVNIVVFGDSVSHGAVNGYNDYETVYWNLLKKKLNAYRDYVPVNMINASIGGSTASKSLFRMQRDVFTHNPDLVIIAFGLNDVNGELKDYLDALRQMFQNCIDASCDAIFLTANMLNTYVAEDTPTEYLQYAEKTAHMQNSGRMDMYVGAAVDLAKEMGITVCDCYGKWKALSRTEDTTLLLANRINHPVPKMHQLFADSLYELIIGNGQKLNESDSTMYNEKDES